MKLSPAILCLLFSAFTVVGKAQKTNHFHLPPALVTIDADSDKVVSILEAQKAFEYYFTNRGDSINGQTIHTENTMIELIAYLEGLDLSDIMNSPAEKRFIDIYYSAHFLNQHQEQFGETLGFTENEDFYDSNYVSEPLIPLNHSPTEKADKIFTMEGQMTSVSQVPLQKYFGNKRSSDLAEEWTAQTLVVATLPIELNFGDYGAINITPEYAGGNGLGDGAGLAGYPNALFGFPQANPYLLRAQYFAEFELKGTAENDNPSTLMVLAGRFILQEAFQVNGWSGDPKRDFLNFNHTMLSAWDAATTAYGFTHGAAAGISNNKYALNFAACTVDEEAGGTATDWRIAQANSFNLQYCRRIALGERFLCLRALAYTNRTWSGKYGTYHPDTLGVPFDFPDSLKSFHRKTGIAFDCDLEFSEFMGVFLRYSINDGKSESMGYTQADRALNIGFSRFIDFANRPDDLFGIAFSINDVSKGHREFITEGGNGFMLGGGEITYGSETAFETFYRYTVFHNAELTLNYQFVINPGYNKDNKALHAVTCRLNFQF